jgi:hypothetical protein
MKIGLIQTGGIGDIIISLPIAKHYFEGGNQIFWGIKEEFLKSFKDVAPWVNWFSISKDDPNEAYLTPLNLLAKMNVEKTIVLYSYLSSHLELADKLLQKALKFDQYKYAVSNVPFSKKWTLENCLQRNLARENDLFGKLIKQEKYMVIHQQGSNFFKKFNVDDAKHKGYQIIEVSEVTDNIFDWLKILENAKALVLIDSVFANLVEQLGIGNNVPKYFGVRSDVGYTPVLLGNWQYI